MHYFSRFTNFSDQMQKEVVLFRNNFHWQDQGFHFWDQSKFFGLGLQWVISKEAATHSIWRPLTVTPSFLFVFEIVSSSFKFKRKKSFARNISDFLKFFWRLLNDLFLTLLLNSRGKNCFISLTIQIQAAHRCKDNWEKKCKNGFFGGIFFKTRSKAFHMSKKRKYS